MQNKKHAYFGLALAAVLLVGCLSILFIQDIAKGDGLAGLPVAAQTAH